MYIQTILGILIQVIFSYFMYSTGKRRHKRTRCKFLLNYLILSIISFLNAQAFALCLFKKKLSFLISTPIRISGKKFHFLVNMYWHSGGMAIAVFEMKLHTAPSNQVGGTRPHGEIGGLHNTDSLLTNKELKRKQTNQSFVLCI